jgi:NYN domain
MRDFEEWAKSLPKWSENLLELGASWDSFRREPEEVISDLVKGGIPLLSAKDIVDKAREVVHRKSAPMAIYWDLDTLTIPATASGRILCSSLKSELSSFGALVQFRGYAGNTLVSVSEKNRTEMIELGCVFVDSPSGGKEVATKRIIIDALAFAQDHLDGATLCFVSGDTDLAYLLATLQRKQWTTVLIVNEATATRMADAICSYKLSWERDIVKTKQPAASVDKSFVPHSFNGSTESKKANTDNGHKKLPSSDVELLRSQIAAAAINLGNEQNHSALKSRVGSLLRLAQPERFPTREDLTVFLAEAVDDGLVVETGYGEYKVLTIVNKDGTPATPPMEIQKHTPPLTNKDLPKKVIELSRTRPYIIFVPWSECVNRETFPKTAFVHTSNKWAMLMFETLIHAQQAAIEFPWLSTGHLLDWRRVGNDRYPSTKPYEASSSRSEVYVKSTEHDPCVDAVVNIMKMLLESDEVYVAEPVLRYQLAAGRDGNTADRQLYFWIEKSVHCGAIILFRRPGVPKGRFYCLPGQLESSRAACNPAEIETNEEEQHVLEMLTKASKPWVTRIEVIESLKSKFPRMKASSLRVRVFQNGARKNLFFVAKDGNTQVVGCTKEEAQIALKKAQSSQIPEASHENGTKKNVTVPGAEAQGKTPASSAASDVQESTTTAAKIECVEGAL